jgi:hypothetical protein
MSQSAFSPRISFIDQPHSVDENFLEAKRLEALAR